MSLLESVVFKLAIIYFTIIVSAMATILASTYDSVLPDNAWRSVPVAAGRLTGRMG